MRAPLIAVTLLLLAPASAAAADVVIDGSASMDETHRQVADALAALRAD
jgi:hypothetical protein